MRDPARIDEILSELNRYWQANPDLRLGQIIVNMIRPKEPCPEVFYTEDSVVLKRLCDANEALQN
ncbi:hypothetical protein FXN63_11660 [Pigmentiphaga aceris]|uniref:DUF1040 family protein n=1 Tax=Pigmentiphaga aceris TaxID=1940612 RepID=A0A5C0AVF2_9BURK|nr:hypothetical protein [Pigmentiphaga aceris]QEI06412.1 hypothetical protein FXN63_11660 [Pigmentiphaga aceris]